MQYYRCKCGQSRSYGSMPPYPCKKCPDCGSNLSSHPDFHSEPKPHNWYTEDILTDEGVMHQTKCSWRGELKVGMASKLIPKT